MSRLIILFLAVIVVKPLEASYVVDAGGPYTMIAGEEPLILYLDESGIPNDTIAITYCWSIGGIGIGYCANRVSLSWIEVVSATRGGDPGQYEVGVWVSILNEQLVESIYEDFTTLDINAPSNIPVPAAFWLFGTALIGLVGFSRRKMRRKL